MIALKAALQEPVIQLSCFGLFIADDQQAVRFFQDAQSKRKQLFQRIFPAIYQTRPCKGRPKFGIVWHELLGFFTDRTLCGL